MIVTDDHKVVNFSKFLHLLSLRNVPERLFPTLETLNWPCITRKEHFYIRLFFGERLRRLYIDSENTRTNLRLLRTTLADLPSLSPCLKDLHMDCQSVDILLTLQQLPQLLRLSIYDSVEPASSSLLDGLRSLPQLQELRASFQCKDFSGRCSYQPGQVVFPSLKKLSLFGYTTGHPPYLTSLLSPKFPPTHLEELKINFPSIAGSLLNLCKDISDSISHATLTRLTVHARTEEDTINLATLRPLLDFKNLEYVELNFEILSASQAFLRLDDGSYQVLASSWPQLRSFGLRANYDTSGPAATIESLTMFVRYCPQLRNVRFNFDATSLKPSLPETRPGRRFSNTFIRDLNVYPSRQKMNPMLVATYLADLFPNLTTIQQEYVYFIRHLDSDVVARPNHWEEVEAALPAAHEQKRALLCNAN